MSNNAPIVSQEIKSKVIEMCYRYLQDYLLNSDNPRVTKEEIIKSLFHLTPEIKSGEVLIRTEKGDIKQTYHFKYRRSEYPEQYLWRKEVLKRDGYICQKCKKANINLHVHHKERWIDAPARRFDINNGITLCGKCHKLTHSNNLTF